MLIGFAFPGPVVAAVPVAAVPVVVALVAIGLLLFPLAPDVGRPVLEWARELSVRVSVWWQAAFRGRPDAGQASAEYALVLLGAAGVALLLTRWATAGDNDKVKRLLDTVFDHVVGKANSAK